MFRLCWSLGQFWHQTDNAEKSTDRRDVCGYRRCHQRETYVAWLSNLGLDPKAVVKNSTSFPANLSRLPGWLTSSGARALAMKLTRGCLGRIWNQTMRRMSQSGGVVVDTAVVVRAREDSRDRGAAAKNLSPPGVRSRSVSSYRYYCCKQPRSEKVSHI